MGDALEQLQGFASKIRGRETTVADEVENPVKFACGLKNCEGQIFEF